MYKERKARILIRLIIWSLIAFSITIITSFIFTKSVLKSLEIAIVNLIVIFIAHVIYDFIWNRIKWGKVKINIAQPQTIVVSP